MWSWRRLRTGAGPIDAVYVHPTTKGYYAEKVVPQRLDFRASPSDSAEDVLRRLPAAVRSFLFHIDMTDSSGFPADRSRLVEQLRARSVRVLNERVTDISKRTVHAVVQRLGLPCTLASRDGEPSEVLIVKTDRNYGGRSERLLSASDRRRLGITGGFEPIRDTFDYKLMPRAEIPRDWWDDERLVVEKYVTDRENRLHRVHVVGNHFAFWSGVSDRPIKKIRDCWDTREFFLRRGESEPSLPPALLRTVYDFVEAFSLDFGAVDLVGDDESRFCLIDANSTPWRGSESPERFAFLQAGWETGSRIPS